MLKIIENVLLLMGDNTDPEFDLWFLPGFAESHLCFREAFDFEIAKKARVILFDLPGFGASPKRPEGITIEDSATLWSNLIKKVSGKRKTILVAHSVAGIILTETVKKMDQKPELIVSIEGNLTKVDAYFSGQALNYDNHDDFSNFFNEKILDLVNQGNVPMSYYSSLQFADAKSLWTLGRSTENYPQPGVDFMDLDCKKLYYWCEDSLSPESLTFLKDQGLNNRELVNLGHWPMNKAPKVFYGQLLTDIMTL